MKCDYFDCGWCYAPGWQTNNSNNGKCLAPSECEYLKKLESKDDTTNRNNNPTGDHK